MIFKFDKRVYFFYTKIKFIQIFLFTCILKLIIKFQSKISKLIIMRVRKRQVYVLNLIKGVQSPSLLSAKRAY